MADAPPEDRGRFYRFTHSAAERFPFLPILRVHRHLLPPDGQDPPPLADLHPGDIVEVAPVAILGPGDIHPETGAPVAETTEVPTAINHPHLELIPSGEATDEAIGAALVQDSSGVVSTTAPATPAEEDPGSEDTHTFFTGGVVPATSSEPAPTKTVITVEPTSAPAGIADTTTGTVPAAGAPTPLGP